jgi:5-methylcytosine-specific restriction endonuclease McrA
LEAKRRATKINATPSWFEKDKIALLYEKAKWLESLTGLQYHVDHIIPLQGDNVCGLHVWANLQILEASINIAKSNNVNLETD